MIDRIIPGEILDSEATITFNVLTTDGLLADGGTDGNYEGTALGTPDLIEYEHNKDGWSTVAATGTFGASGSGEFWYTFSASERAAGLSRGTIAVRITKTGFQRQTARVQFGSGIQPGDTGDAALIFTKIFSSGGYLANGNTSDYETARPVSPTLEWDHNLLGFSSALGTFTPHDDEYYYAPDPTEIGALLARGTVALRISKTAYRTQVARRGFGDSSGGSTPSIVVISPTPSTAPGAAGGFPENFTVAKLVPIVLELTAVGGVTFADALVNGELVYRGGVLIGDFVEKSFQEGITGGVRLHLLPSAGWPNAALPSVIAGTFDAVAGTILTSSFSWELPGALPEAEISPDILAGARDVTADALSRLIWQFTE